jgi:hypothetical protein
MPVLDLTAAELRYLAKMNAEALSVMQFLEKTKGQSLPDLPVAKQLHTKFIALLPEGVPDAFAESRSRQTEFKTKQKRVLQKRPSRKNPQT